MSDIPDQDQQIRLTAIARHLFETCADIAQLSGTEALSALAGAIGICIAHTNDGFTDEKWAEVTEVVRDYANLVHANVLAQACNKVH